MCDYSLHHVATRPAQIEDKLVTTKFDKFCHPRLRRSRRAACCGLSVAGHGDCVRRECRMRAVVRLRHSPEQENCTAARAILGDQHGQRRDPSRCVGIPGRAGGASPRACARASPRPCCNCPLPLAPKSGRIRRRRRFASLRFLPATDACASAHTRAHRRTSMRFRRRATGTVGGSFNSAFAVVLACSRRGAVMGQ